ncbi:MAG TPA: ABC transporter ATP-binding protein [Euzebyales bacterium]|nr:ABC transporter ATP-binding protein [Euzebyales bacterium]
MTTAIAVGGLRFTYPGADRPAVDGMGFTVGPGEIFGFLGPSGAGKTTTQQIVIGMLTGWTGVVEVLGRDVGSWGPELYDQIGVSFELPAGYARLTVREDLSHFALLHGTAPRDLDALLDAVGLTDVTDRAVGALSKGMRVRLNLARALLHDPRVLFLDEPTSGLDPVTAHSVRELIAAERDRGATVFLTTHDMQTADLLCDRVAFVVDGRIVACDTPRALKLTGRPRRVRVEYRRGGRLRVEDVDLDAHDGTLARLLSSPDLETVHTTEASLDDVFVDVTGRRL